MIRMPNINDPAPADPPGESSVQPFQKFPHNFTTFAPVPAAPLDGGGVDLRPRNPDGTLSTPWPTAVEAQDDSDASPADDESEDAQTTSQPGIPAG